MDQATFKSYSVQQLGEYLQKKGVSSDAIDTLKNGLSLLLLTESELATMLPIGDKAIVRAILRALKVSQTVKITACSYVCVHRDMNLVSK